MIGVSRAALYKQRAHDDGFANLWDDAVEQGVDRLEDAAFARAVEGVEVPVFHRGVRVGSVRRYSDALLIALLKAKRPAAYRDNTSGEPDAISFFRQAMQALEDSPPESLYPAYSSAGPNGSVT
jgi:hypothetical protein